MTDNVSITEREGITNNLKHAINSDLTYDIRMGYRYLRKKLSSYLREKTQKGFTTILYATVEEVPVDYITSLQKQYPDKIIKVLLPSNNKDIKAKEVAKFDYYLCNEKFSAVLYKKQSTADNIEVFEVYTDGFETLINISDIYKLKYLSHYSKCIRLVVDKIKPNIIHADNIPYFLGMEFDGITNLIYKRKVVQTVHDLSRYEECEPFWAIINLTNKKGLKKLLKDKVIKKNLTALFGIKKIKPFMNLMPYIEYLYDNYEQYLKIHGREAYTNENILLKRLDDRVLKIFSSVFPKNSTQYNTMFYTLKRSDTIIVNSKNEDLELYKTFMDKIHYIKRSYIKNGTDKVAYPFDINNFREFKKENKKYLIKEFAKKRLEAKFTYTTLFQDESINIHGYLDSFYTNVLVMLAFNNYIQEQDIKKAVYTILKTFELRKSIQVIINFPFDYKSEYKTQLIKFLEQQKALEGKWIIIDGNINLAQFLASSDIIMFPTSNQIGVEDLIYNSLRKGCIPVVENEGICADIIIDIFDDLNNGCGFKRGDKAEGDYSDFDMTFFKALRFYNQNPSGWNLLIKNAINYDNSWDFDTISSYNDVYEKI